MATPIRVANCSGFYGDRAAAAHEMVTGGAIDVLTGDWLAELTMLILGKARAADASLGYARTFVEQMEAVMATCMDKNIRVVSNAGGLNPHGCAARVAEVAAAVGCSPRIAVVDGDDLIDRVGSLQSAGALTAFGDDTAPVDISNALTANAYLGCWGIVDALDRGADIVITGRVTDAALVCGPAAWHHSWSRDDVDQLAGAVVAGHVIECGAQACGGNYSFFDQVDGLGNDEGPVRIGFPWAEVAADGSSTIGKHDDTGGAVTVGTVTSQLLYEIDSPAYLGPDVTARFDTINIEAAGPDRVRLHGVRGEQPPTSLKVAMNELGGYRNGFSVALTGMDIDKKAAFAERAFWDLCPSDPTEIADVTSEVVRTDLDNASTQEGATAIWRLTVKDPSEAKVGRAITDSLIQSALASIPGMYALGGSPARARPYGVYRPATVPAVLVPQQVTVDGEVREVSSVVNSDAVVEVEEHPVLAPEPGPTERVPLGTVVGARSGDKGGNANIGVFVASEAAWRWLDTTMTTELLRSLLPETAALPINRYRLPNLFALNFVIEGVLGEGVAASTRPDAQAKALGEWLRSRHVDVPVSLLRGG